jgi:hypothetical protein
MTNHRASNRSFDELLFNEVAPWWRTAAHVLARLRVNVTLIPGLLTASIGIGGQGAASVRCAPHVFFNPRI